MMVQLLGNVKEIYLLLINRKAYYKQLPGKAIFNVTVRKNCYTPPLLRRQLIFIKLTDDDVRKHTREIIKVR